ncbi:acylphosphatase [Fonticella tunisiensis]|uniref:Acylphosphatase n=1 Tax=Fonticella tunisiensis TaxID=1096341 RepID=A0A4R7K7U4_9CLOT|nr:acylphosphatase [Fonticella tunisiensis]TDT46044.1 acylphosphatase [Fonticella tunisiensis]
MVRYHIIVHGRVQGVGFRYHVQLHAGYNGITGWVRNNEDGTVEVDAEGEEKNMDKFIAAVKKGNHFSKIDFVDIEKIDRLEGYRNFRIKY